MPAPRVLHPEFFESESLARVSRDARLLFAGLIVMCAEQEDGGGSIVGAPEKIRAKVFPLDADVTAACIEKWLGELNGQDCITVDRVGSEARLRVGIPNLGRYQHPVKAKRRVRRGPSSPIPYDDIRTAYNVCAATTPRMPQALDVTPKRREAIDARWQESESRQDVAWWRWYFETAAQSDFLSGRTPPTAGHEHWQCTMDFLLRSDVVVKVCEGGYGTRQNGSRQEQERGAKSFSDIAREAVRRKAATAAQAGSTGAQQ